jgi:hypothetical protein
MKHILAIAVLVVCAAGCAPYPAAAPGAAAPAPGAAPAPATPAATPAPAAPAPGGPVDASTRYLPEQDPAKAEQIRVRMWGIMTAAPCWTMKNSTNNYSFSGVNNYRYAGYETTAGQIILNSTGSFGGYDMADVTISSTRYWIGVYDSRTIAFSFVHDNGALVTNWFFAASPGQACV